MRNSISILMRRSRKADKPFYGNWRSNPLVAITSVLWRRSNLNSKCSCTGWKQHPSGSTVNWKPFLFHHKTRDELINHTLTWMELDCQLVRWGRAWAWSSSWRMNHLIGVLVLLLTGGLLFLRIQHEASGAEHVDSSSFSLLTSPCLFNASLSGVSSFNNGL